MSGPKKYIWIAMLATVVLLTTSLAAAQENSYQLTILHTNDVHGRVAQFNRLGSDCSAAEADEGLCYGGVARRATKIDEIRAEGVNTVLVDAGDQFQGTLFYTKYRGLEAQHFMNLLGYDAMTVGNHEFDDGPQTLAEFIRGAEFPVIAANVDASEEPGLAGLIQPYTVLEVGGEKIGLLGYTTEDIPILSKPGSNVIFDDIDIKVKAAVMTLEEMGINKIIALSHAGFGRDRTLAATVDGIDMIVAGHTNTYLSNTDPVAEGPYPVVIDSPSGQPVLIVSDYTWGMYLGRLDVTFDAAGIPVAWQGDTLILDDSVPEDPEIRAEVDKFNEPLAEFRNQIVGRAATDLDGERRSCRFKECTLGNLIADAILAATASEGVQIVIQNGGGIRASIPAGQVTMGQILEVLPFRNTIATMELKGSDLWAALENGVSQALSLENSGTGRFPQVAGLRYTWNPNMPAGQRLVNVEVKNPDGTFVALDPQATYKIATNDFLRQGGDGYLVFADNAIDPYDSGPNLEEAVAHYIAANSPVSVQLENRISQVYTPANQWLTIGTLVAAAGFALFGAVILFRPDLRP
jgi:5'-nucleotidase